MSSRKVVGVVDGLDLRREEIPAKVLTQLADEYNACLKRWAKWFHETSLDCQAQCPPPADQHPCVVCVEQAEVAHNVGIQACSTDYQNKLKYWECRGEYDAEQLAAMDVRGAQLALEKANRDLAAAQNTIYLDFLALMGCGLLPPPGDVACAVTVVSKIKVDADKRNDAEVGVQQAELALERSRLKHAQAQAAVARCEAE